MAIVTRCGAFCYSDFRNRRLRRPITAALPLSAFFLIVLTFNSLASAQFSPFTSQFELTDSVRVHQIDNRADKQLAGVKAFLDDQQWDEAVETLRQVMETQGDRAIAIVPGRYLSVRDYCHWRIASLPEEALQLYRRRVDPLAQRWYEEGIAERDEAKLSRVADQMLMSSWGDQALLALGEMALSRGQYGRARRHWERISPLLKTLAGAPIWMALRTTALDEKWGEIEPLLKSREQATAWVAYPDTDIDLADVRARFVLVSILEGANDRATLELDLLKRLHPDSRGRMGGRDVLYVEKLSDMLATSTSWPTTKAIADWPAFAGSVRRTAQTAPLPRLAGLAWKKPISLGDPLSADVTAAANFGFGARRIAEGFDELLSYHPIVHGNLLLVSRMHGKVPSIFAYDVRTGEPVWASGSDLPGRIFADQEAPLASARSTRGRMGVPRFTLSACEGKLFAKIGDPVTCRPREVPLTGSGGYLVCLDLEAQGQLLWKIAPDDAQWAFEGSPVSDGTNVYVALRRSDVEPQAYVACFDAQTGRRKWRTMICAAQTPARGQILEVTHNLLTLAEDTLYYNTHLGAVGAINAVDGRIRWITQYRRELKGNLARRASHMFRDLTPVVYYEGILLVAPADIPHILALDASTGALLWDSDLPDDAIHLLGVVDDQLIASGDQLWWLNVYQGNVTQFTPPTAARGHGRGAIAGQEVFWPTRDKIYVFATKNSQTREPKQTRTALALERYRAAAGNLVIAQERLLITGPEEIQALGAVAQENKPPKREVTQRATDRASVSR